MGHKSQIKAQRRAQKIAQVQRERDIAEVFGVETLPDFLLRTWEMPDGIPPHLPVIEGNPSIRFGQYSHDDLFRLFTRLEIIEAMFRELTYPFDHFWVSHTEQGLIIDGEPITPPYYSGAHIHVMKNKIFIETFWNNHITTILNIQKDWKEQEFNWDDTEDVPVRLTLATVWLTLALLNTSNIELVDQPPNPRLSAISEREFGRPLTTYKVLKVNTGHKEYYGRDKDTGLRDFDPRRMHVVRGHHAEYGTNGRKLLFGKYQRKIWIPAHVRGNEELGIVVKDYEVVNVN